MKPLHIIATTISGSIRDWGKVSLFEHEFRKHYPGPVTLHAVDSHARAMQQARELVEQGARLLVSAGGAGTFNSVLEGSRTPAGYPDDLRLAFLRKGSADLMGKVLNIPDTPADAVKIIARSIQTDRIMESDVIRISMERSEHRFIGFGGIGIFGIVPYFTESRIKKYYKGILGQFLGDRGPFLVGVNLAMFKYYADSMLSSRTFRLETDDRSFSPTAYASVIIANGDMGNDFPIASGIRFDSGDFKVIMMRDRGLLNAYRQLINTWKGTLEHSGHPEDITVLRTSTLRIHPTGRARYMVNIDGLLEVTDKGISFDISDSIKLISGEDTTAPKTRKRH